MISHIFTIRLVTANDRRQPHEAYSVPTPTLTTTSHGARAGGGGESEDRQHVQTKRLTGYWRFSINSERTLAGFGRFLGLHTVLHVVPQISHCNFMDFSNLPHPTYSSRISVFQSPGLETWNIFKVCCKCYSLICVNAFTSVSRTFLPRCGGGGD